MDNIHNDFEKLKIPLMSKLVLAYQSAHKNINSFPKHERYALGEKLEKTILEAVEFIVIANHSSKFEKERVLIKINGKIEILKILYRIALNCGIIDQKKYLDEQKGLQECGKMTQGWIKYARNLK